jgi:hypothetical protein
MSHLREETMDGYRSLIILWLTLAAIAGCHYRDPSVDLLEGELRYMEDQVYMLENELHKRCSQLDTCRQECQCDQCQPSQSNQPANLAPLPASAAPAANPNNVYETVEEPVPAAPDPTEVISEDPVSEYELVEPMPVYESMPSAEMPTITDEAPSSSDQEPTRAVDEPVPAQPDFESVPTPSEYEVLEPTIEIPDDAGSDSRQAPPSVDFSDPPPGELPEGRRPVLQDAGDDAEASDGSGTTAPLDFSFGTIHEGTSQVTHVAVDANVTHIVAQAELVTDRGFDDEITDADVLVVIEPRNKDGQYVELTGPVSVVVLDGKQEGSAARLARWDYDASSARRAIRKSALGRGIHLELRWPADAPDSDDLHLFVRYETIEDRKLETDVRLLSNPNRETKQGWQAVHRSSQAPTSTVRNNGWNSTKSQIEEKRSALLSGFKLRPLNELKTESSVESSVAIEPQPMEPTVRQTSSAADESWETKIPAEPISKPEWSPYR